MLFFFSYKVRELLPRRRPESPRLIEDKKVITCSYKGEEHLFTKKAKKSSHIYLNEGRTTSYRRKSKCPPLKKNLLSSYKTRKSSLFFSQKIRRSFFIEDQKFFSKKTIRSFCHKEREVVPKDHFFKEGQIVVSQLHQRRVEGPLATDQIRSEGLPVVVN